LRIPGTSIPAATIARARELYDSKMNIAEIMDLISSKDKNTFYKYVVNGSSGAS
jgi:hypothetical protein